MSKSTSLTVIARKVHALVTAGNPIAAEKALTTLPGGDKQITEVLDLLAPTDVYHILSEFDSGKMTGLHDIISPEAFANSLLFDFVQTDDIDDRRRNWENAIHCVVLRNDGKDAIMVLQAITQSALTVGGETYTGYDMLAEYFAPHMLELCYYHATNRAMDSESLYDGSWREVAMIIVDHLPHLWDELSSQWPEHLYREAENMVQDRIANEDAALNAPDRILSEEPPTSDDGSAI